MDADSGVSQANEVEYNFTLTYKPKQGLFKVLAVKMRYVYIDFDSGVGSRWNTRLIINYKVPGLRQN